MMFLEECVGQIIYIRLNESAKHDATLSVFINADTFVGTKLIAVDELGLWMEILLEAKTPNETVKTQMLTSVVLIKWNFLDGVFVPEKPHLVEKHMGFFR